MCGGKVDAILVCQQPTWILSLMAHVVLQTIITVPNIDSPDWKCFTPVHYITRTGGLF